MDRKCVFILHVLYDVLMQFAQVKEMKGEKRRVFRGALLFCRGGEEEEREEEGEEES